MDLCVPRPWSYRNPPGIDPIIWIKHTLHHDEVFLQREKDLQ